MNEQGTLFFYFNSMEEIKHGEKGIHEHVHPILWQNNWKSPVSLGIFLATAMFGLVMLFYAVNLAGAAIVAMKPEQQSQGLSQQQLQQMMQQQSPATSGASAGAAQ
jgi:hypothetical protein